VNSEQAMRRALGLARLGWGRVHPNPMVGAVVLAGEAPVGEGWHREWGGAHAEPSALAAAGGRARGATMVVTLMPCSHQGKQPPCTEAIIAAGIGEVVAAAADPNPEAEGGADRLRAAGIRVSAGLLECEARRQNAHFFHRHTGSRRPWVALKLATSLDHRIADRSGNSRWISGPDAREFVHRLRAGFAAVGIGGRTALRDDPALTVRGAIVPRIPPARVLFEGAEPLPPTLTALKSGSTAPAIVVTSPARWRSTSTRLAPAGIRVIAAVSLDEALELLRDLGIDSLLIEGGGRLAGALLAAELVDRYYQIQSPLWLGREGRPASGELAGGDLEASRRWDVVERRSLGADTLLVLDRIACSPVW
jgi:diaminohydroxyphosphoribosylaminopyrimidine deaminase/5-amino-6-(5-phosphoribosylamino)uracil reductase